MSIVLNLFLTFAKIGLFTFGGGYAMISVIEDICVEKKNWITHDEMMDVTVVAESTPGPIAINSATYIGFKVGGTIGAVVATFAMCLPSFVIIFTISKFLDRFLALRLVACAFRGIQVCVVYLVLTAGLRMRKSLPRDGFHRAILIGTILCMLAVNLFAVNFSSLYCILVSAALGLAADAVRRVVKKNKEARR